jgi:hypothetical protein
MRDDRGHGIEGLGGHAEREERYKLFWKALAWRKIVV